MVDEADKAGFGGYGVKLLQKTLNSINQARQVPNEKITTFKDEPLKEDNVLGKKTATATFKALRDFGTDEITNAFSQRLKENNWF